MLMTKIGENIKSLRAQSNLSQAALAEMCGWDNASRISNYENTDREPSLHDIKLIAKALNVSPARLAFDDAPTSNDFPDPEIKGFPILDWNTAYNWPLNKRELLEKNEINFLSSKLVFTSNCFAMQIQDDLMFSRYDEHSFKKGSYIIVDPGKEYKNESFVIAKKDGLRGVFFRQYRSEPGYTYLCLLKDKHPEPNLVLTPDITICGVVVAYLDVLI